MTLYYSPSLRRFVKGLTDERPSAVLYLTSSIENLTIIFVASGGGELALSGATASIAIGTFPTFSSVLATANSWILANDNKSATFEVTIDTVEMRVALGTASHVDVVAQLYLTVSSELVASKLAPTRVINSIVRDGTEPPTVSEDLLWNWLKLRAPEANGFEHDDELRTLTVVSVDQIARDAAADAQSTANGKLSPDGDGSQLTGVVKLQTFRALSDGNVVTYDDAGIRYNGPDQWVQLPVVDAARIGAVIEFYGYDSTGYPNGFYTDDGNAILPPNGSVRNWFTVPSRARVRVQLGDDQIWRVTVLDPGVTCIPYAEGSVTLDTTNGSRFYIGYLNNAVTVEVAGGVNLDPVECAIGWTQGTPQFSFGSSVMLTSDLSALMPIDLNLWRSYSFQMIKRGGYWTLKSPIQGPTVESED